MKGVQFAWGALIFLGGCVTAPESVAPSTSNSDKSKAIVLEFVNVVLFGGDLAQAERYLHNDYIQHNPKIPGGREGFVSYFTELNTQLEQMNATIEGEIEHVIAEDDHVMIVIAYRIDGPIKVRFRAADLFRVENGKIAEHWDVREGETLRDHQLLMQN